MPPEPKGVGSPIDWLEYAQADLAMAKVPLPEGGRYEQLCFFAQQAAEKSIKAVLVSAGVEFSYTHDLRALVDLIPADLLTGSSLVEATQLSVYAIWSRYPGPARREPVSDEEYRKALNLAEAAVTWAEHCLAAESGETEDEAGNEGGTTDEGPAGSA